MIVLRNIGRRLNSIQKNVFECALCDLILAEESVKRTA
jgi:hypothetical protein